MTVANFQRQVRVHYLDRRRGEQIGVHVLTIKIVVAGIE